MRLNLIPPLTYRLLTQTSNQTTQEAKHINIMISRERDDKQDTGGENVVVSFPITSLFLEKAAFPYTM